MAIRDHPDYPSYYHRPIYDCVFYAVSFHYISPLKPLMHFFFPIITCYMPRLHIILNLTTPILLGEEYRSLSYSLFCVIYTLGTSSFLGSYILLHTLFSQIVG